MDLTKTKQFEKFKNAVKNNLTADNFYVQKFMTEVGESWDEGYDENGKREWHKRYNSEQQALKDGVEGLLEDKTGYFEEFVLADLGSEVAEMVRVLIKDIKDEII